MSPVVVLAVIVIAIILALKSIAPALRKRPLKLFNRLSNGFLPCSLKLNHPFFVSLNKPLTGVAGSCARFA